MAGIFRCSLFLNLVFPLLFYTTNIVFKCQLNVCLSLQNLMNVWDILQKEILHSLLHTEMRRQFVLNLICLFFLLGTHKQPFGIAPSFDNHRFENQLHDLYSIPSRNEWLVSNEANISLNNCIRTSASLLKGTDMFFLHSILYEETYSQHN